MTNDQEHKQVIVSYNALRKCIGWLAIAMPCILLAGTLINGNCNEVLTSISIYHHTGMGHFFTAICVLIAIILYIYKGYDKDYLYMNTAAVLVLGIGFIPNEQRSAVYGCLEDTSACTLVDAVSNSCFITQNHSALLGYLHLACAIGFFVLLSYICYFIFTKSAGGAKKEDLSLEKIKRNKVYRGCAIFMLAIMVLLGIFFLGRKNFLSNFVQYDPIFWGEWLMIWAFGLAWLTKGEFFLMDKK